MSNKANRPHQHRAKSTTYRPYEGCVAPENCDSRAHGGHLKISTCHCGAFRQLNSNGSRYEPGPWQDPAP